MAAIADGLARLGALGRTLASPFRHGRPELVPHPASRLDAGLVFSAIGLFVLPLPSWLLDPLLLVSLALSGSLLVAAVRAGEPARLPSSRRSFCVGAAAPGPEHRRATRRAVAPRGRQLPGIAG